MPISFHFRCPDVSSFYRNSDLKECGMKRWFWVLLLEIDMCVSHLQNKRSEAPSLDCTPLAFFVVHEANSSSRKQHSITERCIKTMSRWLTKASERLETVSI